MSDDRWRGSHPAHGLDPQASGTVGDERDEWVVVMLEALDDQQMAAVLDGSGAVDGLDAVVEVLRRLRASAAAEPVPPMSAALRALLDEQTVVPRPVRTIARGALVRAAIAATVAAVALLGAGAAQGRLPSGIQDVVSSTAELVGIDVPRSEDRGTSGSGTEDRGADAPGAEERDPAGPAASNPGNDGSAPGDPDRADPGTPGDHQPATPPEGSNGGGANDKPRAKESAPNGATNGTGVAGSNGNGAAQSNPTGQGNGTGTSKK